MNLKYQNGYTVQITIDLVHFQVFHALLDLPCICAALVVSERAQKGDSTPAQTPAPRGELTSLEAYRDPLYNLMFKFVMRSEGGCGDTISR